MKTNFIFNLLFVLLAAAQIFVPFSMILDQEDILATGKAYKFRTQPIDPIDPFRGKYIILNYTNDFFILPDSVDLERGQNLFVEISEDESGFAKIRNITTEAPERNIAFVKATVSSAYPSKDSTEVYIDYPFDRFYMEEFHAPEAEKIYNMATRDSQKQAWAVVKIKDGDAVLEDVMIDGRSISQLVNSQLKE